MLPGSRARIVRCVGHYDPQLVKRSSEWVSEWVSELTLLTYDSRDSIHHRHHVYDFVLLYTHLSGECFSHYVSKLTVTWRVSHSVGELMLGFSHCPVAVWEMLINLLKCPILYWCKTWNSDPESVPGTTSSPKVNQFFRLVSPVITPSFLEIGWLLLQ